MSDMPGKVFLRSRAVVCASGLEQTDEGDPCGFEYIRADLAAEQIERELVEMVVSAYHEGFIDGANSEHPSPQSDFGWARSDTRESLAKLNGER